MNVLVCTLGSWATIAEAWAFLALEQSPEFSLHPRRPELLELLKRENLVQPQEIWVIASSGTPEAIADLKRWAEKRGVNLRVLQTEAAEPSHEPERLREVTLRAVLHAGPKAVLSLAGGRKTMSADLQQAGNLLGCHRLLHIPADLGGAEYKLVDQAMMNGRALPAELAAKLNLSVLGPGRRSDLLDLAPAIRPKAWPLPTPDNPPDPQQQSLYAELLQRETNASRLLQNYHSQLAENEPHENWRSLYRLSPARIDHLRATQIGPQDLPWLQRLPKAELHCHLGGILSLSDQIEVGRALWEALPSARREAGAELARRCWPQQGWPACLRSGDRAAASAWLLAHVAEPELEHHLFGVTEPRVALKRRMGFAAYELPGELSGSALLSEEAVLPVYVRALIRHLRGAGLRYCELRGSPQKYRPSHPLGWLRDFKMELDRALQESSTAPALELVFLPILDRREPSSAVSVVDLAVQGRKTLGGFLGGLDLAGDEGTGEPHKLAEHFLPAFEACLPITIHAGEGESSEKIWAAAYHLHADRIGHGLSLAEHPELARRFRDRDICLELCPSSNREVVGFADPQIPESLNEPVYPFRRLLDLHLPLAICTDNPGLSRTHAAQEFLTLARMTGGLSRWETLRLVRSSFRHSFLPADRRDKMMREVDAQIYKISEDEA